MNNKLQNANNNLIYLLSIGFGIGCVPKIPGTAGTLLGVFFFLLIGNLSLWIYLLIILILFLLGIWICGYTSKYIGINDHPSIIWDEIVGYLITMISLPKSYQWILLGFFLFRFFDILKPWPICWLDKKISGGLGIMLDDLIAGLFSLLIMLAIRYMLEGS